MKRLVSIVLGFILLSGLFGCKQELTVPTGLALSERTVTWDASDGATGYVLKVNDIEYPVSAPSMVLPEDLFGPVALSVKATNDKSETEYSPIVNAIAVIRLSSPDHLIQDGSFVRWDAVPHATGYVVKLNGVEYPTVETAFEIPAGTSAAVQVLAVGRSDGYIVSSIYSEVLTLRISLAVPGNIRLSSGVIVWDAVEDAVSYVILVDEDEYAATDPSIDLRYHYAGEHTVRVMAIADGEEFADSGFGSADLVFPTLTLSTPGNIVLTDTVLSYDAVEGANGYDIRQNGIVIASVETTTWDVPGELFVTPGAYLEVVATSLVHDDSLPSLRVYLIASVVWTEMQLRNVTGGAISLGADIHLQSPWEALDFTGVFEGNGYTISGIEIDSDAEHLGFFGILENAIVKNLTIQGTITVDSIRADVRVGGLAAVLIRSSVENVRVLFDIDVSSANGIGVAGGAFGTVHDGVIEGVSFEGAITTSDMITGGLAGRFEASEASSTVYRSRVIGNVTGNGGEQTPTGGFAGTILDNQLEIRECSVWGSVSGYGYLGGFVGYLGYGTIIDSYVHGDVIAGPMENASLVVAGGFAGRVEGYNVSIQRCLALATLTWNNTSPDVRIGGFAGTTPGGTYATIYQHCGYSDTTLDRIGNPSTGRGDGIALVGVAVLTAIANAAPGIWDFDGDEWRLSWE